MAQATRTELVKRQQHQQVSATKPKMVLKSETKSDEAGGGNKQKPSYKHIPHSQKPAHLVAKRNARERRRVKAVNEAFNTLKKCVPIQNRNKRVSKVKTLQRAIDHIRHLQAVLEADNESAGTSGAEQQRIFVSSKAGEEAELRLAMSPEPRRRPTTKATKSSSSASLRQQVDDQQQAQNQRQRRARKPNAIKQQGAEAVKQRHQVDTSVPVEQQHQQANQQQHYLIEGQTNEYASVAPPHYYSLPQATCHTNSGSQRTPAYAYETSNPHQHYQNYENASHYYQPAFHEQYQPQTPTYGAHFYSTPGNQVPYGDADSSTAQRQQQHPMIWQPALASSGPTRSSDGAPLDSSLSLSQLGGSPASSANLTQLMCNLNTSNSSSECSSSGPNASASCLYNGAAQHHHNHQRRAMPADSTTSSTATNNIAANNSNKSACSLIDSPYSTTSSSSVSSASTSFSAGAAANKSLDSSAPLNLKHADKSSPTSAGGRQVNNYASNNYALPTFVYDPERQQPDDGAKLIGQQRHKIDATHQTSFLCGGDSAGDLYLANNEHQQRHQQQASDYGPNSSSIDFQKRHLPLLSQQAQLSIGEQLAANERAATNGLYNGPTPL